ncbi:MAG: prephenate dehydratase [Candidatus Methanofastidiosia archaeon]
MKVSFQGDRGAFSESMALKLFKGAETLPHKTFKDVFDSVETGRAEYGVIPVENTQTGRIVEPTNLLISSSLKIYKEGALRIRHCLITRKDALPKDIKYVYAHPEALAQCKGFLSRMDCKPISWWDGAAAAAKVQKDKTIALIGNERIATLYDLRISKRDIQDSKENMTKFFVVSANEADASGDDKTTIIFITKHVGGALFDALKPFASANINMTRLESMPIKDRPWEYAFIVEFKGHCKDDVIISVIDNIKKHCVSLKILGSYPSNVKGVAI